MGEADAVRAGGQPPEPQFTNGTIIFHCPKGHRLVVAAKHAGKHGRCDKKGCGAPVTIPSPPVVAEVPDGVPETGLHGLEPPAAPAAAPIPSLAGVSAEFVETGGAVEEQHAGGDDAPAGTGWEFINPGGVERRAAEEALADLAADQRRSDPDHDAGFGNPTARLVARLWEERDHGGIVELHLAGGSVILPEWYETNWSRGTHGLFASQAPDGTVTLTAVAWDAIQKVVVRQVRDLPDGMFE